MNRLATRTVVVVALLSLGTATADAQEPAGQPAEPQPYPQAQAAPASYPQAQPYPQRPATQPVYVESATEPQGPGNVRIPFFVKLGFAGSLSASADDRDLGSADLNPTVGGGAGVTFVIARFFGIGPRLSINRLQADGADVGDNGILAVDLAIAPQVRFPFSNGRLAVYGVVPFGVTVFQSEADDSESEVGFNLGLMGGFEFFLGRRFGLFAEIGFQGRFFSESAGPVDVFYTISDASLAVGGKLAF